MSRNGSGVYSLPAGTEAIPGQTISSDDFNTIMDDLEADANTKRPIAAGGTNADNATDALLNLGALPTDADLVTIAALGFTVRAKLVKTAANTWTLAAQTTFGDSLDAAVDAAAAKTLLALVKADVGLGNVDNTSDANKPVSTAQAAADALKVAKSGDTMSGNLTVTNGAGLARLSATGDIFGYRSGGTTGYVFLNAASTAYHGFDGSNHTFQGGGNVNFGGDPFMTRGANETVTGLKYFRNGVISQADGQGFLSQSGGGVLVWIHGYRSDVTGNDDFVIYSVPNGTALQIGQTSRIVDAKVGLRVAGKQALSHAGSYTSGQVTMSTSSPSGGSDGDVWFQYS